MDNRGKIWSIDDDQKLMESPHLPNSYFCQSMGRSENAIKFRRSHLAVKMHQNDSSASLEEYVGLMGGDIDHAQTILSEWREKRESFSNFLDANRKRKASEPQRPAVASRFWKDEMPTSVGAVMSPTYKGKAAPLNPWNDKDAEERISAICESIRDEGGNLASVFNDPQYVPTLVQHYPGFEAYARVVQARPQ
jgi:hypothetical protein